MKRLFPAGKGDATGTRSVFLYDPKTVLDGSSASQLEAMAEPEPL